MCARILELDITVFGPAQRGRTMRKNHVSRMAPRQTLNSPQCPHIPQQRLTRQSLKK